MTTQQTDVKLKFGLKSFLTVVGLLMAVLIVVGVLTYVIPSGSYEVYPEGHELAGQIIPGSFVESESTTRLPVWRWFTAPFESIIWGSKTGGVNINEIQIFALLLILGGTVMVLEKKTFDFIITALSAQAFLLPPQFSRKAGDDCNEE